jgi:murein L,D-transpeptidase YafK
MRPRFISLTGACLLAALCVLAGADSLPPSDVGMSSLQSIPTADRVLVRKAERRLYLLRGERVLRSYKVALGLNPLGHKEREGDFRTPEGKYKLTRRNPRSDFFLSIQVSYPNEDDIKRAHRNGWDTGGAIMIHGLPNQLKHAPAWYESKDWTDGCIAVSNSDIVRATDPNVLPPGLSGTDRDRPAPACAL